MPELPEVETIARALRIGGRDGEPIIDRQVCAIHLMWDRTLAKPDPQSFANRLIGQKVTGVGRRGKFLLITFNEDTLLLHLRMSGDIRVEPIFDNNGETIPFRPHDRLVLDFADGMRLAFNDTRKFGRAWLVRDPEEVLKSPGA